MIIQNYPDKESVLFLNGASHPKSRFHPTVWARLCTGYMSQHEALIHTRLSIQLQSELPPNLTYEAMALWAAVQIVTDGQNNRATSVDWARQYLSRDTKIKYNVDTDSKIRINSFSPEVWLLVFAGRIPRTHQYPLSKLPHDWQMIGLPKVGQTAKDYAYKIAEWIIANESKCASASVDWAKGAYKALAPKVAIDVETAGAGVQIQFPSLDLSRVASRIAAEYHEQFKAAHAKLKKPITKEVEIAYKTQIPIGYKVVGVRPSNSKDISMSLSNIAYPNILVGCDSGNHKRIILEKEFEWPSIIELGTWAWKNNQGVWLLSEKEPTWSDCYMGWTCTGLAETTRCLDIKWPECSIKDSKMQKPL
jgi:hypothetical protein